jgi:hypothetical protein
MTVQQTFKFPYRGSVVEGYITASNGGKLLIDGAHSSKGLFFVKEGTNVHLYPNRKLATDACMCGGMDGWSEDEYEYNHPITGGPPEYHAGVNQSTKAPKEYPGATEHDLHNSVAGIDEGELKAYNPQSQITRDMDGGPGSGQKGHVSNLPEHGGSHTRMSASHPNGAGKRYQAVVPGHQQALERLAALRANPATAGHHVTLQHPSGRTHTVRPHEQVPSHFWEG